MQSSYFSGVASDVQTTKDALQSAYDKQSADIQGQLDTLKQQQQDALDKEQELTQPFQDQLEQTQEQQLGVTSNFQKNQALADELNSLVTEANTRLTAASSGFTSKSYGQAIYSSTLQDITARAGLIQSAMSAYNGQISAAYTQIDRAVAAINADRNDQLSYYQTLLSLNSAGQLNLNDQAKTLAANKISTLQKEADDAQANADAIKKAMTDPTTAQAYAQAGVTLTDTPEQINEKLGTYAYSQELSDQSNQMAKAGYTPVLPGQTPPPGANVVSVTDSKGNQKQYYDSTLKTQVISLGNGSSKLINTQTGAVLASYSGASGGSAPISISDDNGNILQVPASVAPYVSTSHSGVGYVDVSTLQGTAAEKAAAIQDAQASGLKVITNKDTALDLTNIKDANAKLDTIQTVLSGIDQASPLSRAAYGAGLTWLARLTQSDPQKTASDTLSSVGTDILKALQGVQGSRMSQAAVANINKELPTVYDTNAVVQQKVNYLQNLLSDREDAILGSRGTNPGATTGTLSDGTVVTLNADGSITDAKGNKYDAQGNPLK